MSEVQIVLAFIRADVSSKSFKRQRLLILSIPEDITCQVPKF